jgi:hypothetical protein
MRVIGGGVHRGAFSRFLITTAVLAAILLIAGWFAARSEGGRELIESQLAKRLGMPVAIERTRIGWPYELVLENLRTPGFEAAGSAGFSAAEVRIGLGIRRWKLRLRQVIVRVMDEGDGQWAPGCLGRLGDLRDMRARDIVRATDGIRDRVSIRLTDSALGWLDAEGNEVASARDVNFRMLPVRIEKRRLHYFALDVYRATGVALGATRDMHWEWLTTQELEYIELSRGSQALREEAEQAPDSIDEAIAPAKPSTTDEGDNDA